jgi:hypothetical protein
LNNAYETVIFTDTNTQEINWTIVTSIIIGLIIANVIAIVILSNNFNILNDEQAKQKQLGNHELKKVMNDKINAKINAKIGFDRILEYNKMMYGKSLNELNMMKINFTNRKTNIYQVLLRVQMRKPLIMKTTKYELHSNNLVKSNRNMKLFTTRDMYMSFGFVLNPKYTVSVNIVSMLNYINSIILDEFKISDFIILALSTIKNTKPHEFYNGLININYELFNMYDIVCKKKILQNINNNNNSSNTIMNLFKVTYTLPVHEVYDMFLDAFNDIIFESKKYEIDDNNYESWNGKSINEIPTF